MIVYGHHRYTIDLPAFLSDFFRRLERTECDPTHERLIDLFVDFGEAYPAIADAMMPCRDDLCDALRPWSDVMQALANALQSERACDARGCRAALAAARFYKRDLAISAMEFHTVQAGRAEGFAYFAVNPDQYFAAADEMFAVCSPAALVCIGLRGIGAPLAHVVAAAAASRSIPQHVVTIRPRGDPFDRHADVSAALQARLAQRCLDHVAIVDEGPGLSGSSIAAGVELATAVGAAPERIVLFPSWRPAISALRSNRGRAAFERHRCFAAESVAGQTPDGWVDISAGAWRPRILGVDERCWPAVQPQHERRKHLSPDEHAVRRFAGLGRYGNAASQRAAILADRGFSCPPIGLRDGFLELTWTAATPSSSRHAVASTSASIMASYLAFVAGQFATGRSACVEDLDELIAVNVGGSIERPAALADAPEIAIDGRMLPPEWLLAGERLLKADALDHHADDFFPGARDVAWDVAGTIVEFNFSAGAAAWFVDSYRKASGDRTIERRLPFYRCAYLAYRIGYVTLAQQSVDNVEAARFRRLEVRYRHSLATLGPNRPRSRTH